MERYRIFQTRTKNQYDLALFQIGYEKCQSDQSFGPFKRDCFMLHFLVSGKGTYRVRDKTFSLEKGDFFLLIPEEDTYYEAQVEDPYEYYWVGFRGLNAEKLMRDIGFYKNDNFVFHVNEQEQAVIKKYFTNILSVNNIDEKTYVYILGQFYTILSLIMPSGERIRDHIEIDENVWKEIEEFITFNYRDTLTVESLAAKFGFHRSSLYKLFKRKTGLSPSEYILNYRLDKAFFMIKFTDVVFKSIAVECGFNDLGYFYKAFKRKFKRTPQQVRDLG